MVCADRAIIEVAGELELNSSTLGTWVHKHRKDDPESIPGLSPADYGRLAEL